MLTPTLIVDIGARAARAARAGEATFSVPELADVARAIAADDRVDELRGEASRWLADGARYHDLVRLGARYVREIDRGCPPTAAVYVPKASGELEPMLALWPHVLALPTATPLSERELIELRAYPVHVLGIVAQVEWADGRPCSPGEFFFHDLDHARFKLREDLAARGVEVPDAYRNGTTLDPETGLHRMILHTVAGRVGPWLWEGSAERLALARRLHASVDALADRARAAAADLLLFEIIHEKSFPLEPGVLSRELATTSAHLDKVHAKMASGFYGRRPPAPATLATLAAARTWLLEVL